jgi:phosphatidylglycerol:prolipoprotein diacylglycerol transferase
MLHYPHINPIALHIGFIKIHWYGLMYLIGILGGWCLLRLRGKKQPALGWTKTQIDDAVFYATLGVVLGGRVGYMLFYDFSTLIAHPLSLFRIWEGGMSFHGGLLGVLCSMSVFAYKTRKHFIDIMDFIAPVVPIGLAAGRLGNFINAELWGRVTDVPWGMVFPNAGDLPRHPSQLYEFLLEGVVLFIVLWWFSSKPRPRYAVSGVFALGYGIARFVCEFFRQPDIQKGFIAFDWLTMGQLLCIPMIVVGIGFLYIAYRPAQNERLEAP